jgi:autotransporter-associated beta strand protein
MKRVHKAVIAAAVSSIPLTRAFGQLAAFPGAVGYGAYTTGAREGALSASSVYVVTNLNNSGTGSFRDAVSESNRIIVFAVSGWADITSAISAQSNLTILGQTAPGGGFGVYGAETSFYGQSNDIVQYMHFADTTLDPGGTSNTNSSGNCVNLGNTNNMIFDHDSLEFASYNNIDASGTTGANNLTFQNSIIADPILSQQFNFHWQGNQGTFINNIFANAGNRSILAKGNTQFVNNTIYNYLAGFTTGDSSGNFDFDIVNNYFISGPSTTQTSDAFFQVDGNQTAYASGNLLDNANDSTTHTNGTLTGGANNSTGATVSNTPLLPTTQYLPTLSATASLAFNMLHSGDSLTHDPNTFASSLGYDQVDQTVVADVASYGTEGRLYNTQNDTGFSANSGVGNITIGTSPTSTANDGIPDSWKLTHGLSTTVADSTLLNPLGYAMVEQYAAQIADLYNSQTWSSSSGDWDYNGGNWSSTEPGDYDHALVRGNGVTNGSVTVAGSDAATAYSLSIGGNGPAAGESVIVNGGSLMVYNTITVGDQNNATLQITGGTVMAGNVQLGNTVWNGSGNSSSDYTATTYTGTLILNGGTLNTGEVVQGGGTPGNWTTGSAWTWSGGTLQAGLGGLLVSAPATIGAAGATLDTDGQSATITSVLSGSGGFTKIGQGNATISGLCTYTGPTTILAGALAPTLANGGSPSGLGESSNAAANLILNGGTLMGTGATDRLFTLQSSSSLDDSNGMTLTNTGSIALASGANLTLTFTGTNGGHNTFEPSLGDVGGGFVTSVVVSGTGLWDFSQGVKSYSGTTSVTSGELQTLSTNALSPNSTVDISSGAILDFHAYSQTINALSGAGNVTDSFGNGQTLTIGAANGSGTLTGAISGDMAITKVGTGSQTLSGNNTYTNATTISAGTLTIGGAGQLGGGSYAANIINSGAFVYGSSAGQLLSGVISGSGTLSMSGSGTLTLSASNTYVGNTTVTGGTLELQANSSNTIGNVTSVLGTTPELAMSSGATIQLLGNTTNTIFAPQNAGGATSTTSGIVESNNGTFNFLAGNNGSGTGNTLILANFGEFGDPNTSPTFNFSSANSYNLQIGSGAAGNGTLQVYNNTTINSNTAGSSLLIPGGFAISYNQPYTVTFGGVGNFTVGALTNPTGTLNLIKSGAGVMSVSGLNSYIGTTTVNGGELQVSGTGQISASSQILVGNTDAAGGAVYQSGTSVVTNTSTAGGGFQIGSAVGAAGYYNLSGGTVNVAGEIDPGGSAGGAGTFGELDISGGTVNLPNGTGSYFLPDRGAAGEASVVNISGGSIIQIAGGGTPTNSNINGLAVGLNNVGNLTSTITISGSGQFLTPSLTTKLNDTNSGNAAGGNATNVSVLNMKGGTLQTLGFGTAVNSGGGNGYAVINFNGGTIKAGNASNSSFLSGLGAVNVYSGNGTIDNNGVNITIAQPLLAASGTGVGTVPLGTAGSGYIAPPQLIFAGGTLANGVPANTATGYATINPTTGAVTGIVITNPGSYTSTTGLTVALSGPTGGTATTLGTLTTLANVSGGMTFQGLGTTTLTAANTYAGVTTVNGGILAVSGSGQITDSSQILVANTNAAGGAIYQSGSSSVVTSTSTTLGGFQVGSAVGAAGYYNLASGVINVASAGTGTGEIEVGGSGGGAGTFAQLDMSGGTINLPNNSGSYFLPDRGAAGEISVVNISGGTVQIAGGAAPANGAYDGLAVGLNNVGNLISTITFSNSGQFLTPSLTTKLNDTNFGGSSNSTNVSVLNMNGGTLQTLGFGTAVNSGGGNGYAVINFNGGTIKAGNASNSSFLSGLAAVNVCAGNGTIDNNGVNITIAQPLLAASGTGVASVPINPGAAGSGYIAPPQVVFSGGTLTNALAANTATGYATINPTTGAVTAIVITNPGSYTSTTGLTAALSGPTAGTAATLGTLTTLANASGGMTFQGSGTTTLTGANSYSGGTMINAGTVLANSGDTTYGSMGSGLVTVSSGGTLGGTGQIRGSILVNGTITAGIAAAGVAPGTLIANASGAATTFAGGATYDVKIDSNAANGVAGTNWDELVLGGLNVTAASGSPFNVTLNSLTSANAAGAVSGLTSSNWVVATTTSAPTGLTLSGTGTTILAVSGTGTGAPTVTTGDSGIFALTTTGFDSANNIIPGGSYFALELINTTGTDYSLEVYTSAPEPGSALLVCAGAAGMLLGRRRRRGTCRGLQLD